MKLNKKFRLAKQAASLSEQNPAIGAAIYKGNKLISIGCNKMKSHPLLANEDRFFSLHAEMTAILNAKQDLDGCDIYVYREFRHNQMPALSKPCDDCMMVLLDQNLKRCYYTDDNKVEGFSVLRLNEVRHEKM